MPTPHRPPLLWPAPRSLSLRDGGLALPPRLRVLLPPDGAPAGLELVQQALAEAGVRAEPVGGGPAELVLAADVDDGPEAYRLEVGPERVRLAGRDAEALFRGCATLAQLVRGAERGPGGARVLPALSIRDRPAFPERGAMLDVSRDRVPRLGTLFALVERFAAWKLNRLQLYTEHAFAYAGHEEVWRDASPYTPDDVRALDAHCRALHVELVPNQQSFGHMHRWLKHARYRDLAECPEGVEHPFAFAREPFSLCPTDPRSLELLAGLYDQLLPCFASATLDVGFDETFDLGLGRSRGACAARGTGAVYLDFLRGVHRLAAERGRGLQLWADVVLRHPELVRDLPRDATLLLWGYEADHPFAEEAARVAGSGLAFHVAPGTSSWQSVLGRTGNLFANVARAARAGEAAGARGLLVTDWGDRGHLQPLPASLPGWVLAAGAAWNPGAAGALADLPPDAADAALGDLVDALAPLSPPSPTEVASAGTGRASAGRALVALGRSGEAAGIASRTASPLSQLLTLFPGFPGLPPCAGPGPTPEGLQAAREVLERGAAAFAAAPLATPEAPLLRREVAWGAALLGLAADLGLARLAAGPELPPGALPAATRGELAERLAALEEEHGALWLERNRPGGLGDSRRWLARVREGLEP